MSAADLLDGLDRSPRHAAARVAGWLAAGAAAMACAVFGGLAAWWLDQRRGG